MIDTRLQIKANAGSLSSLDVKISIGALGSENISRIESFELKENFDLAVHGFVTLFNQFK